MEPQSKAVIKAISYWIPEIVLSNEDISNAHPEWSVEKISAKTGIYERRISAENIFASDLAVNAAEKLFVDFNIDKLSVDFLLLCTQSPDYLLPTTACIVHEQLGLAKSAGALDFNLGCSGYVYGLGLAKGLLLSGSAKKVLLITADTYSKYIHEDDKSNKTLFGDAAAATLICLGDGGLAIEELVFGTDGSGANNLIVKNGGLRNRGKSGQEIRTENNDFVSNNENLFMNGAEIFKFTAENVPKLVKETLVKNNLQLQNIDLFVFHQANRFMLDFIRKKIGIDAEKFFYFMEKCGNTVSSTIPIAISEALKSNKIIEGNNLLLAGFGVGYSWGGCILKKI